MSTVRLRVSGGRPPSREVGEFVDRVARRTGLSPSQKYRLRLAADELTANVTVHGYGSEGGVLDLVSGETGDAVWLSIEDDAPPFDPTSYAVRAARATAGTTAVVPETGRIGGYGVQLALSCVDEVRYDHDTGRNRCTLVVHRVHPDTATDGRGHR